MQLITLLQVQLFPIALEPIQLPILIPEVFAEKWKPRPSSINTRTSQVEHTFTIAPSYYSTQTWYKLHCANHVIMNKKSYVQAWILAWMKGCIWAW